MTKAGSELQTAGLTDVYEPQCSGLSDGISGEWDARMHKYTVCGILGLRLIRQATSYCSINTDMIY